MSLSQYKDHLSHATAYATPVTPPIAFFWAQPDAVAVPGESSPQNQSLIQQCSQWPLYVTPNVGGPAIPVPPYFLLAAPVGYIPYTYEAVNTSEVYFHWSANVPMGTEMVFAMTDSVSNSGGSVDGLQITPGFSNCTFDSSISNIFLSTQPFDNPCDYLDVSIDGGQAPFTVSVLAGASGLYANLTGVSSGTTRIANVVPAGQMFHMFVTDANGESSVVSMRQTSSRGLSNCQLPESGPTSGTSLSTIIGSAVGGSIILVLLGLVIFFLTRRKRRGVLRKDNSFALKENEEYRMADGTAPVVTPFVIPVARSNVSNHTFRRNKPGPWQNNQDGERIPLSLQTQNIAGHNSSDGQNSALNSAQTYPSSFFNSAQNDDGIGNGGNTSSFFNVGLGGASTTSPSTPYGKSSMSAQAHSSPESYCRNNLPSPASDRASYASYEYPPHEYASQDYSHSPAGGRLNATVKNPTSPTLSSSSPPSPPKDVSHHGADLRSDLAHPDEFRERR